MADLPYIVFDVNDTLLDLETLQPTFERIFGDKLAMRLWFVNLILYSAALTVANSYVSFTDIGAAVMKMLADVRGVKVSEADRKELIEKFSTMPPHSDREAGSADAPVLLLLRGFPTSSHMFRDLIPLLADSFRLVAPDLPGFGRSDMPARSEFAYTFDHVAGIIDRFTDAIGLTRFAIYVFDYGAPTGFRIAAKRPERITAIISQNGNAYEEGLSDGWNPIRAYWQYTHGAPDLAMVSPDGYSLDNYYLARPGVDEAQLDLFGDYKSNVALSDLPGLFPTHNPRLLAVWGKNDPFFLPAGAEAFKRDISDGIVRFLDTGHFALETHAAEIASAIRDFLPR
jgi:pimeloyl-ACP methyl ester carboxylesterase